jgi:hypothetical protein
MIRKSFDIYALILAWSHRSDFFTNARFALLIPVVHDVIATDTTLVWG